MRYKHIFWDWNGTLLDDLAPSMGAINVMLEKRGREVLTVDVFRDRICVPIIGFYEQTFDMSVECMDPLAEEYHSLYQSLMPADPLARDAKELLALFYQKGIKQYIFSSSETSSIERALKKYGIDGYFECVIAASDRKAASKAERTRQYIIDSGIQPRETLFVGDLVHDSEVADYVGADCVLVEYGHEARCRLFSTERNIISELCELKNIVL